MSRIRHKLRANTSCKVDYPIVVEQSFENLIKVETAGSLKTETARRNILITAFLLLYV